MAVARPARRWTTVVIGWLTYTGVPPGLLPSLPRRSRWLLYAAGFFAFFAFGFAVDLMLPLVLSPLRVVALAVLVGAGAAAAIVAAAFYPRWLLAVTAGQVALTLVALFLNRSSGVPLATAPPGAVSTKLYLDAIGCTLGFIASYAAFMRFIGVEGSRYARAHAEIELARDIHQSLVPTVDWSDGRYEIHGVSRPSAEVGGDLVDLAHTARGWIGYVADVSGHGVGAGLMMGILKSAMRTRVASPVGIDDLLTQVNEVLVPLSKPNMYATLALLHDDGRELTFAVAGHPPILHYRAATAAIAEITLPQIPLGMFPDRPFTSATVDAAPGDLFVIVTDGLTEVFNAADEEFGLDGVKGAIAARADAPLAGIADAVIRAAREFGPQADDQTLLLVRVRQAG